jgi:hypothetical protein
VGEVWSAIEGDHKVMQNITANPKDGRNTARNVGKLAIEDEPQDWKGKELDLNLMTPSVERNDALCCDSS